MMYEDELEQIKFAKEKVVKFLETIRYASLPKDLENEEIRKAKAKIEELEFYEQELTQEVHQNAN